MRDRSECGASLVGRGAVAIGNASGDGCGGPLGLPAKSVVMVRPAVDVNLVEDVTVLGGL